MSSVAEIDITQTLQVQLPLGLLGFERIKTYSLISKPDQEPFRWLSVPDGEDLAFLVVPLFTTDYVFRALIVPFLILAISAIGLNILVG